MKYKLIATDMDNTLFGGDYAVSPGNKAAIRAAAAAGVTVVPCSGRSFAGIQPHALELGLPLDGYAIAFNGGATHIIGTGEAVRDVKLSEGVAREVTRFLHGFAVCVVAYKDAYNTLFESRNEYTDKYAAMSQAKPKYVTDIAEAEDLAGGVSKVLVLGTTAELARISAAVRAWGRSDFGWVFSSAHLAEFMPPGVSKGAALKALCGRLGVDMREVIAIGDQENDLSMIEAAGLGAAIANGTEAVKARADYVTENDCGHDGVAEVIHKFILSRL